MQRAGEGEAEGRGGQALRLLKIVLADPLQRFAKEPLEVVRGGDHC